MATKHPSSRRYPPEVKQRAVQLVLTTIASGGRETMASPPAGLICFTQPGHREYQHGGDVCLEFGRGASGHRCA